MEQTQQVATQSSAMTAKTLFARDDVKNKFAEMLGKRSTSFITSVLQIVASNKLLSDAEPSSIYQAAAMAATLDLPLNNNLGFAYIVPYNQSFKKDDGSWGKKQLAQFQLGYKGYIQLAQRSGQFKTLSATPIYEGQIVEQNPLTGYVFDFSKKDSNKVIGYAAYFELINGFQKILFMSSEDLNVHGGKYSKSFNNSTSLWKTDFDAMATKTVLKLLLSKFAPLSVDMQRAIISDQSVITNAEENQFIYIDNEAQEIIEVDKAEERIYLLIQDATTKSQLKSIESQVPESLLDYYNSRVEELKNAK